MSKYAWAYPEGAAVEAKPVRLRTRRGDNDTYNDPNNLDEYMDDHDPRDDRDAFGETNTGMVRLTEQFGLNFPNPDSGTEFDDRLFQNLERGAPLDLAPALQQAAQRLSLLSYRKNVRAFRTIELITSFVWGDGPSITANDDRVQQVINDHWRINGWARKGPERIRSLALFGEQIYPTIINSNTGLVRISSIDPFKILRILRDEENAEEVVRIITTLQGRQGHHPGGHDHGGHGHGPGGPGYHGDSKNGNGSLLLGTDEGRAFEIIRLDPDSVMENPPGMYIGESFYFAVNRIAGATRGTPDLLSAIDWLEGLDSFIFGLLERANITQNIVYDLEFQGLRAPEIRKRVREFVRALKNSGGIYGHNEKTKLSLQVPKLGTSDAEIAVKILLKQVQAGTGLAGLFFGDSDDLTRASASELSIPVAKMIQARQTFVKGMLDEILSVQIQESIKAGRLPADVDRRFSIKMCKVYLKDLETIAKSLNELGTALASAVEQGWITDGQAKEIFIGAMEQLGTVGDPSVNTNGDDVPEMSPAEKEAGKVMESSWERFLPAPEPEEAIAIAE